MFSFSFGELLLVAFVALIVLGPKRLPKAAYYVGSWVRMGQDVLSQVQKYSEAVGGTLSSDSAPAKANPQEGDKI